MFLLWQVRSQVVGVPKETAYASKPNERSRENEEPVAYSSNGDHGHSMISWVRMEDRSTGIGWPSLSPKEEQPNKWQTSPPRSYRR